MVIKKLSKYEIKARYKLRFEELSKWKEIVGNNILGQSNLDNFELEEYFYLKHKYNFYK